MSGFPIPLKNGRNGRRRRFGRKSSAWRGSPLSFEAPDKLRPVVVLTRETSISRLAKVTVAPITSTIRGVDAEVILDVEDGMKGPCVVNLHNLVTVVQGRMGKLVAQLSQERMDQICDALRYSLGCDQDH